MRNLILLIAFCILMTSTFAWDIQNAEGQLCFNLTSSTSVTGSSSDNWYDVAIISLDDNSTFWENSVMGYHLSSSTSSYLFQLARNSSHRIIALPIVDDITAGNSDQYCFYSGASDYEDITEVAPYGLGFDDSGDMSIINVSGACDYAWSDGIIDINATGVCGFDSSSAPSGYRNMNMIAKFRNTSAVTGSDRIGVYTGYTSPYTTFGYGVGMYTSGWDQSWYTTTNNFNSTIEDDWYILIADGQRLGDTRIVHIYDQNFSLRDTTADYAYLTLAYDTQNSFPAYVRGTNAQFDYGFFADHNRGNWTVSNIIYDFRSDNITISQPSWSTVYDTTDSIEGVVTYSGTFDNCTYTVNGNYWLNYTNVSNGQTTTDTMNPSHLTVGENNLTVSCYNSGTEEHEYAIFSRTVGDADELFDEAFDIDIGSLCPGAVLTELDNCNEYYKLERYYNFSAVVCPDIAGGTDVSCVGIDNISKNGYTIFYSPSSWTYPGISSNITLEHVGAVFYHGDVPIHTGIELLSDGYFIYIPAQDKMRDCGVQYGSNCSWWGGFTLNNASVYLANRENSWYVAGGNGIPEYSENYSRLVITVGTIELIATQDEILFGIYNRMNCYQSDDSYVVNIQSTVPQTYTLTVTGNDSYSYSTVAATFIQNITLYNDTTVTVSADGSNICYHNGETGLFLPFDLAFMDDGFGQFFIWILMLFSVILACIVPHGIIITFILNDIYDVLDISTIALIAVMAVIGGLMNNIANRERGIKHATMIIMIVIAYLSVLSVYEGDLGVSFSSITNLTDSFEGLTNNDSGSLAEMAADTLTFLVNLFVLVLSIPALFMDMIEALLEIISPTIFTRFGGFVSAIKTGITIMLYLKAFEVITNKFRGI